MIINFGIGASFGCLMVHKNRISTGVNLTYCVSDRVILMCQGFGVMDGQMSGWWWVDVSIYVDAEKQKRNT